MRGTEFAELSTFVAVAEEGSFTKAAQRLGIALPTVSQTVRTLEERLGVRLLNRTTRSVALTEAGERLLGDMQAVLNQVDLALEGVNAFRDTPTGTLRLIAMRPAANTLIAPLIPSFLAEYPGISVELAADDTNLDIVSGRFDAGIRIENMIEKDMIALPILRDIPIYPVATPAYLERHGVPQTPADLHQHDCLRLRWAYDHTLQHWGLSHPDGTYAEIAVNGRLIVNDMHLVLRMMLAGVGIGYLPEPMLRPYLANGSAVRLLDSWAGKRTGLFLSYPSRRQMPRPLQAFIEFIERNRREIAERSLLFH
ncbi:MAG TPA: LysR family transcriptional regulator [Stellaceae bacterium]|jgi:DNA-binding transcriptional LysR family regulator|nr:LysR family transcriptional regulator [Stellaceae bacterium]